MDIAMTNNNGTNVIEKKTGNREYEVAHKKPPVFYESYGRKAEL